MSFTCTNKYHKRNNYGHVVYCSGYPNIPKIERGEDALSVFLPTLNRWFCSGECEKKFNVLEAKLDEKYSKIHLNNVCR